MSTKTTKYFSIIIVAVVAILAGWWLWNYHVQPPWTRDGKIRVEQVSITPQVSGCIVELNIEDNQLVKTGDLLLMIDGTPFQIAELNVQVQLAKAQSNLAKANNEVDRRRYPLQDFIPAEEFDTTNLNAKAMQVSVSAAQATLKQTQWQLAQTETHALVSGWVTNLITRIGDYTDTGKPLFTLVDSHSFYVIGCFEETKLRHICEGALAQITLYNDSKTLQGHVSSIGRAIYDRGVESDSGLTPDIRSNVPWVRLARRVPVRFTLDKVPGDVTLVSGTIHSIAVGQ